MSLELHPNAVSQAEELWKSWSTSSDVELEASFKKLDLTGWLDIIQHLRNLGLQEDPQPPKLNILVGNGLRFTLVGESVIQEFCKDNSLVGKPFHVVLKEKKRAGQTTISEVDWKEYGVRIKLRRELPLSYDDPRVLDAISRWPTLPKAFRYIKRYSFSSLQHKGIQFDLSLIRENKKDTRGDYIRAASFLSAEIPKQPAHYEVEVEALEGAEFKSLLVGIATVLRGHQRSFVLVRDSVKKDVLQQLAHQTGAQPYSFPGPQPSTLERANILPSSDIDVPNLRKEDYNVTDKADGQRCLMIVAKTGHIYLVDTNLTVYGTDRRLTLEETKQWAGTVLDGEWVRRNAENKPMSRYYAFDIYNGMNGEDVSQRPFIVRAEGPVVSRLSAMRDAVAALSAATYTVKGIPAHLSLSIHMKTFRTPTNVSEPNGIFKEAASILDTLKKNPPYNTDGLIFTPNKSPLPKNTGSWSAQLKWKPAEDNTIDFLVITEKESDTNLDLISTKVREDTNELVRYKTLRLLVGSNTDPAFLNPRETILQNKTLPSSTEKGEYKPVEFYPQPADPMASVCYMAIGSAGIDSASQTVGGPQDDMIRCTRTGDPITSRSIVEMAYHPDRPAGWRWEPIRVRWDKTERFQRGIMARTMNADWVANSIWNSIHSPVTESMIRTGAMEESVEESNVSMAAAYYIRKAPARDLHRVRGLREFHNRYVKEELLLTRILKSGGVALYDMTCGQAGDIHKWNRSGVRWVLGTDIAELNLTENRDGAYRRYMDQVIRNKGKYPPMLFIQANVSQRLSDGGAGQTPMDRAMLRCLWGNDEALAPPAAVALKGQAAAGFDAVSCMFSAHYFFKDKGTLDGWIRNISDTLKVGGYFAGCCFDGDSVISLLHGLPMDGIKRGEEGGVDIWSITKRYENDVLPASEEGLGKAIDVSFISIGETYTEYLVSWEYLKECMAGIGCELLNEEELADFGLKHSTNLFSESYDMAAKSGRIFPMSPILKKFSFLNRWFIFRRRTMGMEPAYMAPGTVSLPTTIPVQEPTMIVEENMIDEELPETVAPVAELVEPANEEGLESEEESENTNENENVEESESVPILQKAGGAIYKFFTKLDGKDEIQVGDKEWKMWLTPFALSPIKDWKDPSIVYPSMEAAIGSAKFQVASNKPELGPKLFSDTGVVHQKYEAKRIAKKEDAHELMEKEGTEYRKMTTPSEMKKVGATFDQAAWNKERDSILDAYVKQRMQTDARFRKIVEKLKEKSARIVYFIPYVVSDLSAKITGDVIDGENALGKAILRAVGLTF